MQKKSPSQFRIWLVLILAVLYVLSLGRFLYQNYLVGDSALWQLALSGFLLSIPLVLFYGTIGVLAEAAYERRQGSISGRLAKLIYWSPRLAGVLIIFFVSLFALDMFSPEYTLTEMLVGFLIHMLPSIVMSVLLILAWRRPWIGFLAFLLAALYFLRFLGGGLGESAGNFLLFSGPLLLVSLLFGVNWLWRQDLPGNTS